MPGTDSFRISDARADTAQTAKEMSDDGDRRLGLGILSAARIARKMVRGILKNTKGLEVVAVAARSLDRAQAFINDNSLQNKTRAYGSYEQLLADPAVQAVYIPLPTGPRVEWVVKAAAAGKHVMTEKPIAMTAADTDAAVSACAQAGVQYMDATMWVHNPRAHEIRALLDDSELMGPLKTVVSCFNFLGNEDFMANNVRVKKELDGLGCLGDIGWYCLGASLWAFNYDPPSAVQCQLGPVFNSSGVLMHCAATVLWDDGRRAAFDCGYDRWRTQLIEVGGTHGFVLWHDHCIPIREDVSEYKYSGISMPAGRGFTQIDHNMVLKQVPLDRPQETHLWEAFAECVYRIQAGKPPDPHWPAISSLTNKVVLAIQDSADNECKVIRLNL